MGGAMNAKQEILTRLRQITSEQLGVPPGEITEDSTWIELGADSLDRLAMSRAVEDAFKVDIPHPVGERLNTVGGTADHLLALIAVRKEFAEVRIEAVTSNQQWAEMLGLRTQVFTIEHGFQFRHLPGPQEPSPEEKKAVWHFLARDSHSHDAIGTLSVVETTRDRRLHERYRLTFGNNDRIARYAQLAILKPYRKRGIFKMLIESAEKTVIRPNGFAVGWLLCPAAHARSPMLTSLGFAAQAPILKTEFGSCRVLTRRELPVPQVSWREESFPVVETCPI
jgi:acyl carrier protein